MKIVLLILVVVCSSCTTEPITQEAREESFNYTIKFCGECMSDFLDMINSSNDAVCALYNLNSNVIDMLEEKKATVIVNSHSKINSSIISKRNSKGLMHNKFCVFDRSIVWTGSWNPTGRSTRDDVVIINSTILAKNYLEKFKQLKNNLSSKTNPKRIILNQTVVENYFCPEDNCIKVLQSKITAANKSVYFATYSFTHPKIANELIIKSGEGVAVSGIIEKGTKYSQLQTLQSNSLDVVEDNKKGMMHHKFFIIDNEIVITGSFNPTRNGNRRNDENLLIITNSEVASAYLSYFSKLRDQD